MKVNKNFKIALLICVILLPTILSSCWDKKEINERAFINAIYIDKNFSKKESNYISSDLKKRDDERLFVSFGIANAAEGQTSVTTFSYAVTGTTFANVTEKLDAETSRTPFFGHTKLIILGKSILEEPDLLGEVLDDLARNTSIDRGIKIIAADNSNITLESLRPKTENLYSSYITGVMDSSDSIAYTLSMNMGQFFNDLRQSNGRAILPVVRIEGDKLKIDRAALINKYTLKKAIGAREVRNFKLFQGIDNNVKEYIKVNDVLTTFKMSKMKRDIFYDDSGNVPKFHLRYLVEGGVVNYEFQKQVSNKENVNDVEKEVKKHIKTQIIETIDFFQNQLGLDYLGLNNYIEKFYPKELSKYKDWDKAFQKAEISLEVEVSILRFGEIK